MLRLQHLFLFAGESFPFDRIPADLERFHVLVDGMGRDAVGDGLFDLVKRDEAREVGEGAEGDDVREERLADFFNRELRDRSMRSKAFCCFCPAASR